MKAALLLCLVASVAPLLVLRGGARFRWIATALAACAAFGWLRLLIGRETAFDDRFGLICLAAALVLLFAGFLFRLPPHALRWTPLRAATIAGLFYATLIPSMLWMPIDGDEPYYLLVTESIVHDHDLDLRNQYRDIAASVIRRPDLGPQPGDPVGHHGEQYSRHEPFLSFLLVPGYLAAGLPGAVAVIAIFGALLVRSTLRLLEDEGISDESARIAFFFFALTPPILCYATRVWVEVPAALCFVEAVRGIRQRRPSRWMVALTAMILFKLRFLLIGVVLALAGIARAGRLLNRKRALWILGLLPVPMIVVWLVSGSLTNVHSWRELLPGAPIAYLYGFLGLLVDGQAGLLFQAPFYLLALAALVRLRDATPAFRLGCLAIVPYVVYLVPRAEWHGGWSPPLRYITVAMPILALGAAKVIDRSKPRAGLVMMAAWSAATAVHAVVYPWRLFHIANGENPAGEALSELRHSDFSRLFASLIRPNTAAAVTGVLLVIGLALTATLKGRRLLPPPPQVTIAIASLALAFAFSRGLRAGDRIDLEDAHVIHEGGELYPRLYMPARFLYSGGWILRKGDSLSVLARGGRARLRYSSAEGAMLEVGGNVYPLAATGEAYATTELSIARRERITIRCLSGSANLDRIDHE